MFKSLLKTSISGGAILFIQTNQNGSGYVYWKYWGSKLQEYSEIYRFVFTSYNVNKDKFDDFKKYKNAYL